MYYHILIETNEKVGRSKSNRKHFELDKTNILEIEEDIIIPYLDKLQFQFDGYFLNPSDIARLVIKQSDKTTKEYSKYVNEHMSPGIIMYVSPEDTFSYDEYMQEITKKVFADAKEKISKGKIDPKVTASIKAQIATDKTKVFIVHGQDETAKLDLARFIEKMGFEAIILHEQVSSGNTIIEKIEEFSNVGFGVVLYTPCDVGAKKVKKLT
jgi:predicted nucleotide-binding protein